MVVVEIVRRGRRQFVADPKHRKDVVLAYQFLHVLKVRLSARPVLLAGNQIDLSAVDACLVRSSEASLDAGRVARKVSDLRDATNLDLSRSHPTGEPSSLRTLQWTLRGDLFKSTTARIALEPTGAGSRHRSSGRPHRHQAGRNQKHPETFDAAPHSSPLDHSH